MLQAEPEDGTGTPLGLAGVVVEIAKHRGVDDEGGTDEISGTDVIDNCQMLCRECNRRKSAQ